MFWNLIQLSICSHIRTAFFQNAQDSGCSLLIYAEQNTIFSLLAVRQQKRVVRGLLSRYLRTRTSYKEATYLATSGQYSFFFSLHPQVKNLMGVILYASKYCILGELSHWAHLVMRTSGGCGFLSFFVLHYGTGKGVLTPDCTVWYWGCQGKRIASQAWNIFNSSCYIVCTPVATAKCLHYQT